ncbi:MAG TPA: hypothetical protein DEA44_13385 [Firmicutes bacterium]|nr:hypothetical protein [Bacillota bacterium]HWR55564.1 hypothetical protein [Negativicutes bacterium]
MKKTMLACLAGAYFLTGVGQAAPAVDIAKGDTLFDISYNRLHVDVADLKLNATEIGLTHGLSDKIALSTGVTFTGDETFTLNNQQAGPFDAKIYDVKLQYKMTKELAPFIGYKKWEINYEGLPADREVASKSGLQYGLLYNQKLSEKTSAFAAASFGRDMQEYKVGLAYNLNKNCSAEINYKKISLDAHDKDIDAKGVGLGISYKF